MEVPWAQAVQVGATSLDRTFLITLGLVIWLAGLVLGKIGIGQAEAADKKGGE